MSFIPKSSRRSGCCPKRPCVPITPAIVPQLDGTFLITFTRPVNGLETCGGLGPPPCCSITATLTLGFVTFVAAPDGLSVVATLHIFLTTDPPIPIILALFINLNPACPLVGKDGCPVTPLAEAFFIGESEEAF
jgi:hypothetical protein